MAMANENIVDVLTEYKDGALIYRCTLNGKTKTAKYAVMKLWLMENDALVGMVKILKGLNWVLELSTVASLSPERFGKFIENHVVSQKLSF